MAADQKAFRGRNDNGSETTATWKANQNVDWTQLCDENFRVRFLVQNATAQILNLNVQLQYNLNSEGWNPVNGTSVVARSSASGNFADQDNTTQQLTGGTGTFIGATCMDEGNGNCGGNSLDVTATGNFECEFCLQLRSADLANNDTVQLRTINSDTGLPWGAYTSPGPSITVSKATTTTLTADKASLSLAANTAAAFKETFLADRNTTMAFTAKTATFSEQRILTAEKADMGFLGGEALFETITVQEIPVIMMAPYRAA